MGYSFFSGTGIVGLAAAASGAFSHVLLTDLPSVLPLTSSNANANSAMTRGTSVVVMPLRWDSLTDMLAVSAHGPFDVIVGGDLLYRPQVVEPLIHVIRGLVSRTLPSARAAGMGSVLLAASIQHSPETLRQFAAAAAAWFEVELLGQEAQHPDFSSEEVRLIRLSPLA